MLFFLLSILYLKNQVQLDCGLWLILFLMHQKPLTSCRHFNILVSSVFPSKVKLGEGALFTTLLGWTTRAGGVPYCFLTVKKRFVGCFQDPDSGNRTFLLTAFSRHDPCTILEFCLEIKLLKQTATRSDEVPLLFNRF